MRKLLLLLFIFAIVASACSGGGAVVATVNGTAITLNEVESLRIESSTAGRDQFNQDLFQLIVEETVRQAAASQYAIIEDDAAVDAQFDQFIAGIEAEGPLDEYLETNGITEETIRHVAFQQVMLPEIQQRLVEEMGPVDEEAVQAAYLQALPSLSTVCVRHILVTTEEEAAGVLDRLTAGEDFGELAAAVSIDPGSGEVGGDLGCTTADRYVTAFAEATLEAEIGEVAGPVSSEFGFHLLIVDSRETQALDDIRTNLEASLVNQQANDLFDEWIFENLRSADIVVTERYGTWQTEPSFGVVSPA